MTNPSADSPAYVLAHAGHGRTPQDQAQYKALGTRYLNVHGRWSSNPSTQTPVLAWLSEVEAVEAAASCGTARRIDVGVLAIAGNVYEFGRNLALYDLRHAAALEGYLPLDQVDAAKREVTRQRVLAAAAYLVGSIENEPKLLVRARELVPKAGIGAPDFLLGKTGLPVAEAIMDGELAADEVVTREEVLKALALAREKLEMRSPNLFTGAPR